MRILLTADPELPVPPIGYGGIERIVAALAQEFVGRGLEVALIAHPDSTARVSRFFPWATTQSRGLPSLARNGSQLLKAVRSFRPDVVHSFSRLAYLLPRLLGGGGPTVMSYQRQTGGPALTLAARAGGSALAFTGCSEFICQQGRPRGGRWHAIHNFVDVRKVEFRAEAPANAPLLFLSRIEEIKGAHIAIEIARTAGRHLILAGNRVDSPTGISYWNDRIAPLLSQGGVEWVGEVDEAGKWRRMGDAAALIVPIQWDEPFGIVFVEALAAGVPVITCARGAAPEIIDEGRQGFFISNVEEGVKAVQALSSLDRRMCRERAETKFSVSVGADRYFALYRQLIQPSPLS